jgi:adhesin transport system outer membrane protein
VKACPGAGAAAGLILPPGELLKPVSMTGEETTAARAAAEANQAAAAAKPAPIMTAQLAPDEVAQGLKPSEGPPTGLSPPGLPFPASMAVPASAVDQMPVGAVPVAPSAAAKAQNAPPRPAAPTATAQPVAEAAAPKRRVSAGGRGLSLGEAVRRAVSDNALIGLGEGRVAEALAGIGVSRSALYPQLDVSLATGHDRLGNYSDTFADNGLSYFSKKKAYGAWRSDVTFGGRQLIYDFGATSADVGRADAVHKSEGFSLQDQTEDISQKVTEAYLRIIQARELIAIADENVGALQTILSLIGENEKAGNATVADIKRVRARLIDAETLRADADSDLQNASDVFERLVHVPPGPLAAPPPVAGVVPPGVDAAIAALRRDNPGVLAARANLDSARLQLKSQLASALPKVQLESEIQGQDFRTNSAYTTLDAKLMLALRYKILDGGLESSQADQMRAQVLQAEMKMRDATEQGEADLRQAYRALETARAKEQHLAEGTADALKAKQLYEEQYKGGKRSLLELLDVQSAYFQARTAQVQNRFVANRASFAILRGVGKLTRTMLARS